MMLLILFFSDVRCFTRVSRVCVRLASSACSLSFIRTSGRSPFDKNRAKRLGIISVSLFHRLADHVEFRRVDHHQAINMRCNRIMKKPRCRRYLHGHLIGRPKPVDKVVQQTKFVLAKVPTPFSAIVQTVKLFLCKSTPKYRAMSKPPGLKVDVWSRHIFSALHHSPIQGRNALRWRFGCGSD